MSEKRAVKEKHGKQSKFELLRCRRSNPPAAPYSNSSGTAAPLIILHPTQQHKFTPTTKRHRQDASCRCLFYIFGASLPLQKQGRNPLNFLCAVPYRVQKTEAYPIWNPQGFSVSCYASISTSRPSNCILKYRA